MTMFDPARLADFDKGLNALERAQTVASRAAERTEFAQGRAQRAVESSYAVLRKDAEE